MFVKQWDTLYEKRLWKFYKEWVEVDSIPWEIKFEFDRWERMHNDIMWMKWKIVDISYSEEHGYFIRYKNWEQNIILDPVRFSK